MEYVGDLREFQYTDKLLTIGRDFIYGMRDEIKSIEGEFNFSEKINDFIKSQEGTKHKNRGTFIASGSDIRKWLTYYEIIAENS